MRQRLVPEHKIKHTWTQIQAGLAYDAYDRICPHARVSPKLRLGPDRSVAAAAQSVGDAVVRRASTASSGMALGMMTDQICAAGTCNPPGTLSNTDTPRSLIHPRPHPRPHPRRQRLVSVLLTNLKLPLLVTNYTSDPIGKPQRSSWPDQHAHAGSLLVSRNGCAGTDWPPASLASRLFGSMLLGPCVTKARTPSMLAPRRTGALWGRMSDH